MDTIHAIETRRAVKHFDPDHQMTPDEQRALMRSAMLSPTSYNIQNWRFVLVKDPAMRDQIQVAGYGQAQLTEASLLVVLTADIGAWNKQPERYWKDAPDEIARFMVDSMVPFYEGREQIQRDEAMRSVGIAAQTIMLSARAMGYDSCPMIGFDADAVGEIINLPDDHVVGMIVVVGKALTPARPRGGQLAMDDVVIENRFSS